MLNLVIRFRISRTRRISDVRNIVFIEGFQIIKLSFQEFVYSSIVCFFYRAPLISKSSSLLLCNYFIPAPYFLQSEIVELNSILRGFVLKIREKVIKIAVRSSNKGSNPFRHV